jgi:hypothetical protein
MESVRWTRQTNFTGRNGYFLCTGVEILPLEHDNKVMLTPYNSRGETARCDITVPLEALDELIDKLQAVKSRMKGQP